MSSPSNGVALSRPSAPPHPRRKRWTLREALEWTTGYFSKLRIAAPRLNAEKLLGHALCLSRVELYLDYERPLSDEERTAFRDLIRRRAEGEPLQYIIGRQGFRYLDLIVAPGVLIPRPETEVLVDQAMAYLAQLGMSEEPASVIDVGTGSGAVALSIVYESDRLRLSVDVSATDISQTALELAGKNADLAGLAGRIRFVLADLLEGFDNGIADLVISNPPYIASEDLANLPVEIREHEPLTALDGGPGGLQVIERLINEASRVLRPGGTLMFEVGGGQADDACSLLGKDEWSGAIKVKDLTETERVIIASKEL